MNRVWKYGVILFFGTAFWGCSNSEHGNKMEEITSHNAPVEYEKSSLTIAEEEHLDLIMTKISELDSQFFIPQRAMEIKSFPCSNCHTKNIEDLKKESSDVRDAHWNISVDHASELAMNCATCHDMNKPDDLTSLTGNSIQFDHSYQLCGQCHSTQYKDWQGGSHGKQLAGWLPPRISQTCTGCHDPHKPAFESRWPSRLNTEKLKLK